VRPGAVSFLFSEGEDATSLLKRLREQGWWGAVLGPHGSGKSALLATLIEALERLARRVLLVELREGERRLPGHARRALAQDPPEQLVIDGYEQLGRLARWRLRRFCRRSGLGLLVSAHGPVSLPELYRTRIDLPLVQRLVAQLQAGHKPLVGDDDVAAVHTRHGHDVRELLFTLYDLYESRR
jgi:energy-coupling factor transporter ATP-binding protein EcfA2